MGAVAFQKGLGAVHALSHPIGAKYNCHHGTTNAILINSALILNKPSIEKKIKAACRYLNFEETFDSFCGKIDALNSALKIPKNFLIQVPCQNYHIFRFPNYYWTFFVY